jgi:poly-beta-1,6-N-acetyl-D-glucosamine synthase
MEKIIAVIPARNEAESITATLEAMLAQTVRIDRIIVCPNNCTDNTAEVAGSVAGVEVMEYPGYNAHNKAGVLNWTINMLLPDLEDEDLVLVTDADSILDPAFIESAMAALSDERVGAVCASFYGQRRTGLLSLLQCNEYRRFSRQISRRRERTLVLSGVASVFPVALIREVMAARHVGRLPGRGDEFYDIATTTEDMELTFAIKALGYIPLAPNGCRAFTDTMPTLGKLYAQRIRWQHGTLDCIRLYGVRRATLPIVMRVLVMYAASAMGPLYLGFLAAATVHYHHIPFDWRWALLSVVFMLERSLTVRRDGWAAILTAVVLIPEWCYEQFRGLAYWAALWRSVRRAERVWVPT